ncbi:MAG: hypothetical protein K1X89_15420 [Myxococcaceae bacterium]|nr:hypothetical protein [Myxococcaceae bacterium]
MKTTTAIATVLLTACATGTGALAAPTSAAPTYFYEDGVKRQVTPVPDLVVALDPGAQTALKTELPKAEAVRAAGHTTLLRAPPSEAAQALGKLRASNVKVSQVYREGTSPAGRLMALPGGVVVQLKPEWTEAQVAAWAAERKLPLEQHLPITGNWYVVSTPAGEASLATANALQESGTVVSATPNWWKEATIK